MRNYGEFSALWRATRFSKAFFQDVALNWRGIAARYLLLLVALSWLVILIPIPFEMATFVNHDAPEALKDFPTIKIEKGVASSDVPQPYMLKDDRGKVVFVLDTTGKIKEPKDAGTDLLVTQTELVQQDSMGIVQRRPLSAFPDMTIDKDWILSWLHLGRKLVIPAGLTACGGFSLGYRLVLALLMAAIGLPLNKAFGGGLQYAALMRLAIVSMTGPVILDSLFWIFHVPDQCWGWFLIQGLTFGYFVYAIKAASEVVKPLQVSSSALEGIDPSSNQAPPPEGPPPLPPENPKGFDDQFP
ncbi:MAG TPA: DUF1189 family protein [Phycisphaerae bacterium]